MKKQELKQLIKETISSMGYVDAKMEREPLSDKAVSFLMGTKKKLVKEESASKRIDGLIKQSDLKKFKTAAIDIFQDLTDEDFDKGDILEFLIKEVTNISKPY